MKEVGHSVRHASRGASRVSTMRPTRESEPNHDRLESTPFTGLTHRQSSGNARDLQDRMDRFEALLQGMSSTLTKIGQGSGGPDPASDVNPLDWLDQPSRNHPPSPDAADAALPHIIIQSNTLSELSPSAALPNQVVSGPLPSLALSHAHSDVPLLPGPGQVQGLTSTEQSAPIPFPLPRVVPSDSSAGAAVPQSHDLFGPTSIWTHRKNIQTPESSRQYLSDETAVDWSRSLPRSLALDSETHQHALELFEAYYAPWTMLVDMRHFWTDLRRCNRELATSSRTAHYSPLLHNCALYFGLSFMRGSHPGLVRAYEEVFNAHCAPLLLDECDQVSLGSLKAYHAFSL